MKKLTSAMPVWLPAFLEKMLFPLNAHDPKLALASLENAMNAALDAIDAKHDQIDNQAVREVGGLFETLCNDASEKYISISPAQRRLLKRRR